MRKSDGGDCYEVAGRIAIDARDEYTVCHGTVVGTGGPHHGRAFGHAWVEFERGGVAFVMDQSNGNDVVIPAELYYRLGSITDVARYTGREACQRMVDTGHFGPW